jgi:hypothetical protein
VAATPPLPWPLAWPEAGMVTADGAEVTVVPPGPVPEAVAVSVKVQTMAASPRRLDGGIVAVLPVTAGMTGVLPVIPAFVSTQETPESAKAGSVCWVMETGAL